MPLAMEGHPISKEHAERPEWWTETGFHLLVLSVPDPVCLVPQETDQLRRTEPGNRTVEGAEERQSAKNSKVLGYR